MKFPSLKMRSPPMSLYSPFSQKFSLRRPATLIRFPSFTFHNDISSSNILIDPTTHHITGIVDWECVSLQPSWEVVRVPQLFEGPEVDDSSPMPEPDSEEGTSEFHTELRERFEHMLLRRVFHDEMGGQPEHGSRERWFENKIQQVDLRPTAVRNW